MGNTSNKSKQQWNATHYTQIKISVDPSLAMEFKKACADANVSMASAIIRFMRNYCESAVPQNAVPSYSTRRKRRAAVKHITRKLLLIRGAEGEYADKIPCNLQGSIVYERAEQAISVLDEAIDLLETAY